MALLGIGLIIVALIGFFLLLALLDRFAMLAAQITSLEVVAEIDKALQEIHQEWIEILELRKAAVRRHGGTSPAPTMAMALMPPVDAALQNHSVAQRSGITIEELLRKYRDDKRSTYSKLRYRTREHYDSLFRVMCEKNGQTKLEDLKAADVMRLRDQWAAGGKTAMGHAMFAMLRLLVNYGATVLEDAGCVHLSVGLRKVKISQPKSRADERLTVVQVVRIIDEAHKMGLHNIALAQAIQFEANLSQKDVIGEWVPKSEQSDDPNDVTNGNLKWTRGIRWERIDNKDVLHHVRSRDGRPVEIELSKFPAKLVMSEIERLGIPRPASGPVVLADDDSGLPYRVINFRRYWRKIATAAGIPKSFKNADSRTADETEDD